MSNETYILSLSEPALGRTSPIRELLVGPFISVITLSIIAVF